jgi:hypothetical protein
MRSVSTVTPDRRLKFMSMAQCTGQYASVAAILGTHSYEFCTKEVHLSKGLGHFDDLYSYFKFK